MKPSSKIFMGISGIFLIFAGIIIIANPGATLVSLAWLLGFSVTFAGVFTFLFWLFGARVIFGGPTVLFAAIGEILIGAFLFGNNIIVAEALPYIFGIWILIKGVDVAVRSFDYKAVGFSAWWILLLLGIASAVLGIFSLTKPIVGSSAISILLGLGILLDGVHYIIALFGIQKFERNVKKDFEDLQN